jgi:hypothetical protein
MELENANPNGDNVVASNLNTINFLKFFTIVNIELKNKFHMLLFLQDVLIVCKTKLLILFTSLINIRQIKASLVDLDLIHKNLI